MITRTYLLQGDKASNGAVIIGGSTSSFYEGTPTAREGDQVYCPVCKQIGAIVCVGPRWSSTEEGKEEALSGDICVCGCKEPPVFYASRPYIMVMTGEESQAFATGMAAEPSSKGSIEQVQGAPKYGATADATNVFDEMVVAMATDGPISDYPYFVETSDGRSHFGYTDAHGRLPRIGTTTEGSLTIYWGDEALTKWQGEQDA